jgi:type II secretory pathway pseudopilin PulG
MIVKPDIKYMSKAGMTLSEVVIAIGIIAFSIPLIVAASGGAYQSRQAAETETRSAWLVRDVQRNIINKWAQTKTPSNFENTFPFPSIDSPQVVMELRYKQDGTLLADDTDQAIYLVKVMAEPYFAHVNQSKALSLAKVTIHIRYPAKASSKNRKILIYQFICTRDGIL